MPGRPARLQLQALPCTLSPEEATRSLAEATKLLLAIDARRRAHQRSAPTSCGQDSNAADVDVAEVVAAIGAIDQLLRDPRLPLLERAIALRTVVASVRPFDAEPGRDGRCNPVPGVEIEFHAVDGVERITLRATLSTAGGVTLRG